MRANTSASERTSSSTACSCTVKHVRIPRAQSKAPQRPGVQSANEKCCAPRRFRLLGAPALPAGERLGSANLSPPALTCSPHNPAKSLQNSMPRSHSPLTSLYTSRKDMVTRKRRVTTEGATEEADSPGLDTMLPLRTLAPSSLPARERGVSEGVAVTADSTRMRLGEEAQSQGGLDEVRAMLPMSACSITRCVGTLYTHTLNALEQVSDSARDDAYAPSRAFPH